MKTVKDKFPIANADFAGFTPKEAAVAYPKTSRILGRQTQPDTTPTTRFLLAGSRFSQRELECAPLSSGANMGLPIAASMYPHIHA